MNFYILFGAGGSRTRLKKVEFTMDNNDTIIKKSIVGNVFDYAICIGGQLETLKEAHGRITGYISNEDYESAYQMVPGLEETVFSLDAFDIDAQTVGERVTLKTLKAAYKKLLDAVMCYNMQITHVRCLSVRLGGSADAARQPMREEWGEYTEAVETFEAIHNSAVYRAAEQPDMSGIKKIASDALKHAAKSNGALVEALAQINDTV